MYSSQMIFKDVGRTMNIVVFVSGGGGNLNASIELAKKSPELINVFAVVSDRSDIKAISIAKANNIPVIMYEFDKICGKSDYSTNSNPASEYKLCCNRLHDLILIEIELLEKHNNSSVDLLVLSYHRIISGNLYDKYRGRIVNQHPADLTVLNSKNERMYVGIGGLKKSIVNLEQYTRTSTILIDKYIDTGSILAQGEKIPNSYDNNVSRLTAYLSNHENTQKAISDWPVLKYVLENISLGNYSIAHSAKYNDGSKVVCYKNKPLTIGGIRL